MSDPVATVILPTFDHAKSLALAVRCALDQTVPIELFIIGDGVSGVKRRQIEQIAASDERIRFFDHPKHESRGEPYRHEALEEARGRIVAYLCDRDIWFPEHVAYLAKLLEQADFAHSLPMHVFPNEDLRFYAMDLGIPIHRYNMLNLWNRVPLSAAAHSLAFYRSLASGWDTTPEGQQTDWHFFKKFLARRDCRCVSGPNPTTITFPSRPRRGWTDEQRFSELEGWLTRTQTEADRKDVALCFLKAAVQQRDKALGEAYTQLFQQNRAARRGS